LELRVPTILPACIPPTKRHDDYLRSLTVTPVTLVILLCAGLFLSAALMS
jgi:hypothetical protein